MAEELQYAAFVDLMGFADGQESLQYHDAQKLMRVIAGEWTLQPELSDPGKVLYLRYSEFHSSFRAVSLESPKGPLRLSVAFSDSGFVADAYRQRILEFSIAMMQQCYSKKIPIRIGIGRGTVGVARFSNSFVGQCRSAEAQIFGTAIVRSYRAFESQTAKGFRVLIHPSAEALVDDEPQNWEIPKLPSAEQSESCVRELNFLRTDDGETLWDDCRDSIDYMRRYLVTARAMLHYDASVRALDRFERALRARFGGDESFIRIRRHELGDSND